MGFGLKGSLNPGALGFKVLRVGRGFGFLGLEFRVLGVRLAFGVSGSRVLGCGVLSSGFSVLGVRVGGQISDSGLRSGRSGIQG